MTTSLDEPKHLHRKEPGWTQLGVMLGVVLLMILGIVAFVVAPLVASNNQHQPPSRSTFSNCDGVKAAVKHGDAHTKQVLREQIEACK